ncbi:MAG: hypothetical protein HOP33_15480 [Verrucomicrobia bacterium]|nr:hypothetical protein [Verrucomicrobiota bacterium]
MIALPELLVVLGVIVMMIGYVFVMRHLLRHADDGAVTPKESRQSKG